MNKVTSEIFLFVGLRIWFSEAAVLWINPFLSIREICEQVEKNRFGLNLSVETCKVAICDCCFFLIVVFKYLLLVYFRRWGYFCTSQETGIERLLGDAEQLDCFVEIVLSNKMGISQSISAATLILFMNGSHSPTSCALLAQVSYYFRLPGYVAKGEDK